MDDFFKTLLGTTCNDDFSGKIELGVKEILHGTFNTTFQTQAKLLQVFESLSKNLQHVAAT